MLSLGPLKGGFGATTADPTRIGMSGCFKDASKSFRIIDASFDAINSLDCDGSIQILARRRHQLRWECMELRPCGRLAEGLIVWEMRKSFGHIASMGEGLRHYLGSLTRWDPALMGMREELGPPIR